MKNVFKKPVIGLFLLLGAHAFASAIVPLGNDNNMLYYKIGGSNSFALPPVSGRETVDLSAQTDLGLGYSCSAFNPALSLSNALNGLKNSAENIAHDLVINATGSLIMMPMYELAKSNPTLYALLNNQLLSANHQLEVSTKSCEAVKEQISRGENPYQDWGRIAVDGQWQKQLSFAAMGNADINQAKKDIDAHSGEAGVAWPNGKKEADGSWRAGGKGQPPVQVVADTAKAGYNVLQGRVLQSDEAGSGELARYFATPRNAMDWITQVAGDERITTCHDEECTRKQGNAIGHGLLPQMVSCSGDPDNCVATIRGHLVQLVEGGEELTQENLAKVAADGMAVSPEAIQSIHLMGAAQQAIIINKLAQEAAVQRVIDKALAARRILAAGAQAPVIAANHPAQVIIERAMRHLDNDIRSLAFESQIRKQMMSDTLSQVLAFSKQQERQLLSSASVETAQPLMENGAQKEQAP